MLSQQLDLRSRVRTLSKNAKRVLVSIARMGGSARYSELKKKLMMADGVLTHSLNRLIEVGLIKQDSPKGDYKLTYLTPWIFLREDLGEFSDRLYYLGLLGVRRDEVEGPVYRVAVEFLASRPTAKTAYREAGLGVKPRYVWVVTSEKAKESWESLSDVHQWILLPDHYFWDMDIVKEKIGEIIEPILRDGVVVMDATGDGKPAALAFYELALEKMVPLIYIHRLPRDKKLRWLQSPIDIWRDLGLEVEV